MVNRFVWMEADNIYPYRNLAMEEHVTLHVPQGTCTLHLWQNRHTVVIGKSQNCWRECRVNFLEQEDGYLVHHLLGGSTVFHDLGNLNFTFTVGAEDYDISRQLDMTLEVIRNLGIYVEKTGCNDITVEGRKFSGNVFYRTGDGCYHHGTILVWADKEDMPRYLNVLREKLAPKGVTFVKSRVVDLCKFKSDITPEEVKAALAEAFSGVYGQPAVGMKGEKLSRPEIDVLTEKSASWQWKYGGKIPFEYEVKKRFPWGSIQIQLHVDEGVIQDVNVFSDAMDWEIFEVLAGQLKSCGYAEEDMCVAVEAVGSDAFRAEEHIGTDIPQSRQIREDIKALAGGSL